MKRMFLVIIAVLLLGCSNQTTCEPIEIIEEEPSLESQVTEYVYSDLLNQEFFLDFIQATMSGYYQSHGHDGFNLNPTIEVN